VEEGKWGDIFAVEGDKERGNISLKKGEGESVTRTGGPPRRRGGEGGRAKYEPKELREKKRVLISLRTTSRGGEGKGNVLFNDQKGSSGRK